MDNPRKGGRRLEKKPGKKHYALKITLSFFAVLLAVGFVYIRFFYIKPPALPGFEDDGIAYHSPEFHPDDAAGDAYDIAPKGVTNADRKKDFYTFLIVGVDGGVNTDTIMVGSYDGVNKEANLISFPRDTLVNVSRKVKKINAAYPAGTLNGGGKAGGISQLKREMKSIIGFVPDFYVVIDLKAFVKIVDAVGGVEVDVPYAMKYSDPVQNLYINIAKGRQTLNGAEALKFARYRKGSSGYKTISDYDRINNQQAVIKGVLDKLLSFSGLTKVTEIIGIATENVFTDLSGGNLLWFAEQLNNVRGTDALSTHTIPTEGGSGSPNYYEYLDKDGVLALVNSTINPYNVAIKPEDIDIINSVP